jgi:hypothetical protein
LFPLKPAFMVMFIVFLAIGAFIVFSSNSHEEDLLLIPSVVGSLWSLSAYALLSTFHRIPRVPNENDRFLLKIKLRLKRFGYWVTGVLFLVGTAATVAVTVRLINIWYSDYIG